MYLPLESMDTSFFRARCVSLVTLYLKVSTFLEGLQILLQAMELLQTYNSI